MTTVTRKRPSFASRARTGPERRLVLRDAVAAPAAPDSAVASFRGHALVYDEWTEIYDWWWGETFLERIARGAAAASIQEDDVRFLLNHDANYVLARRRGAESDTLRLSEDEVGVLVEADMDTRISYVRDLAVALERGDISGMSFAFEVLQESWDARPDGTWMRTIEKVRLYDVSTVTYPAYEGTDGGLRSLLPLPNVRSLRRLFGERAGRRNSAADAAVIQEAIDALRNTADDLEELLADEETEPDESASARAAALVADERRVAAAFAAYHGLARATGG